MFLPFEQGAAYVVFGTISRESTCDPFSAPLDDDSRERAATIVSLSAAELRSKRAGRYFVICDFVRLI